MSAASKLLASRLEKLASASGTGVLPCTVDGGGAVYLQDGQIVYAESARTPGSAGGPPVSSPGTGGPAATLAALLAASEPTVDALLQLRADEAAPGRFRTSKPVSPAPAFSISVRDLLAEVTRRELVLSQLAAIVTPDTTVLRSPQLGAPRIRVTSLQWSLLIRVGHVTTPRELAWQLGRSVFGTTAEVYRLLMLRLLIPAALGPADSAAVAVASARTGPADAGRARAGPARRPPGVSFLQAGSEQKGSTVIPHQDPAGLLTRGGR